MKIGLDAGPSWSESCLPVEIIGQIVLHLARWTESTRSSSSSYTLWACCLVSRDWYGVAISHLYRHPKLVNKNFDLFTRTICPPINAHVRNIGLERFVRQLDMGRLAYESKNSLTSRLLGRVGPFLEHFIAPPVSFSISCLAPLSRCELIQTLDLSRIYQPLDVTKLLRSLRKLGNLTILQLPDTTILPSDGWSRDRAWPPTLRELQIPGWIFQGPGTADTIASFPSNLTELTITHCKSCPLLTDRDGYDMVKARGIKSLTLQDSYYAVGHLRLLRIFTVFPSMLNLSLPAEAIIYGVPDVKSMNVPLETLELTRWEGHDTRSYPHIWGLALLSCVLNMPHLWQLALDPRCVNPKFESSQFEHDIADGYKLTPSLKQRAEERNQMVGHEEINLEEAGFFYISD